MKFQLEYDESRKTWELQDNTGFGWRYVGGFPSIVAATIKIEELGLNWQEQEAQQKGQ